MLRSSRGSTTSVKDILCPASPPPLLSEIGERREQMLYRRRSALGRPSRFSQELLDCLPNRNATFGLPTPRGDATAKDLLSPPHVAERETKSKPWSTSTPAHDVVNHDAQSHGPCSPPRRRHGTTGSQVKTCMAWADLSDDPAHPKDRFETMSQVPLKQALELHHHQHGARGPPPRPSRAARTASSNPITWAAPATDRRPPNAKKLAVWAVSRKIGSHHDNPEPTSASGIRTPSESAPVGHAAVKTTALLGCHRSGSISAPPLPHRKRISDTKNYGDLLSVGDLLSPASECLYHPDVVRRTRLQLGFVDELDEASLDSP
ncbi:hypothetical protein AMAG_18269 [Allomyces macrogynus ATCC 38327]|uniref:Uncharacterized protein n=1 Tax=Allomyces macrogynus (strain ATCC 38327) TaxID=578462 RepID=A0A0L0S7J5_ALLM3|nr:hypothetical protein AMAG_18269 [Allomyces macrogynus ATCC 38327]|eukprot:KNE58553.1 hypothetical protein AMAG_18269 [Allomyces macrogynus ATCC 38327]